MRSTTQAMRNRHVPNPRSQQFHKTRPFKTLSPIVTNIVMTDGIRNHLSCQPTSANALGPCRNSHACHRMKKCPMACTCHAKQRFRPQKCPGCPTCAMKNWHSSKNEHRALIKVDLGKWAKRETCFVRLRACAVEMDMDISQGNFCASLRGQRPKIRASTLIKTRPVRLLRDSLSAGMLWGESSIPHACESSCITCIRLERKAGF